LEVLALLVFKCVCPGKWELVDDFVDYPYSSAKFYELGEQRKIKVCDYRGLDSESPPNGG